MRTRTLIPASLALIVLFYVPHTVLHAAQNQERLTADQRAVDQELAQAVSLTQRARIREAQSHFRAAIGHAELAGDSARVVTAYGSLGESQAMHGDLAGGDRTITKMMAAARRAMNDELISSAWQTRAMYYSFMGDSASEETCRRRALEAARRGGSRSTLALVLKMMGNYYAFTLDRPELALPYYDESLAIRREVGPREEVARSLHNLGASYARMGQLANARAKLNESLNIKKTFNDPTFESSTYSELGLVDLAEGDSNEAYRKFSLALHTFRSNNGHYENIEHRANLARACIALTRWREAERYVAEAEGIARSMNLPKDFRQAAIARAELEAAAGRLMSGLNAFARLRQICRGMGDRPGEGSALVGMAEMELKLGRFANSERHFEEAVRLFQTITEQPADPVEAAGTQERTVNVHARYGRLLSLRGSVRRALEMVELGRARGLSRQLALGRADMAGLVGPRDAERFNLLQRQRLTASGLLRTVRAERRPTDPGIARAHESRRTDAQRRYDRAVNQLAKLVREMAHANPRFAKLFSQRPPNAAVMLSSAQREPDTLFLEWSVVDDGATLLFGVSGKLGVRVLILPTGAAALDRLVAGWLAEVNTPDRSNGDREKAAASKLYSALLEPAERAGWLKDAKRLALAADGRLAGISFAALVDRQGRRLVESTPLSVSSSLAERLAATDVSLSSRASRLYCVVDPLQGTPGGIETSTRGRLGPLKHAREEGQAVRILDPRAVIRAGAAAREGEVKRSLPGRSVLHFATHGTLDSTDGLRSALLMAQEKRGSGEDGWLEAREILGLHLTGVNLAVLSACNTASGQRAGGDGLLGLAWAFRAAGCRSVVASQWRVDDRATSILMRRFYEGLKRGMRKDDALRAAMLSVKKTQKSPYYWAAFQVMGSPAKL